MGINSLTFTYRSVVYDINDPENLKRARLIIPSVFGPGTPSGWAWPMRPNGAAPVIGEIVYAAFENGDPNNPLYFNASASGSAGTLLATNNLSDLANVSTARTSLGLGSAAITSSSAYDTAGAASSAQTAAQASSAQRASNLSDLASVATARTNLGLGSAAVAARAFWVPADNNLLGATSDPATTTTSGLLSAGVVIMAKVLMPTGGTIANVLYSITTAGATLTAAQNFVGVYSTAATAVLLGLSADQSTNYGGGFTNRTAALTLQSGQSLTIAAGGSVYVAFLFNGTTSPTLVHSSAQGPPTNIGLSAGTYRGCVSGSAHTTLPGTITLSGTTTTSLRWAGVS